MAKGRGMVPRCAIISELCLGLESSAKGLTEEVWRDDIIPFPSAPPRSFFMAWTWTW